MALGFVVEGTAFAGVAMNDVPPMTVTATTAAAIALRTLTPEN